MRHYKLDRVEAVEVSPFPFQRPEGFDLAAHLAALFGVDSGDGDYRVRVRFLPPASRYVLESTWHASQQLMPKKDGSLIADFRLSGLEEVKRGCSASVPARSCSSPSCSARRSGRN